MNLYLSLCKIAADLSYLFSYGPLQMCKILCGKQSSLSGVLYSVFCGPYGYDLRKAFKITGYVPNHLRIVHHYAIELKRFSYLFLEGLAVHVFLRQIYGRLFYFKIKYAGRFSAASAGCIQIQHQLQPVACRSFFYIEAFISRLIIHYLYTAVS